MPLNGAVIGGGSNPDGGIYRSDSAFDPPYTQMPYNFIVRHDSASNQMKFRVSSSTPAGATVDQFEPIHNWKWLSDYSSATVGQPFSCIFYSSFGIKSSSMTMRAGCASTNRLDLSSGWNDPANAGNSHDKVGVRYSSKSVLGLEFWNHNAVTSERGFIDDTCYPTTNTLEYYGGGPPVSIDTIDGTSGKLMTKAEEIRLIFELDYVNFKSNLKYIEVADSTINGGVKRIGNTDTTKPTYYI